MFIMLCWVYIRVGSITGNNIIRVKVVITMSNNVTKSVADLTLNFT